MLSLAFVRDAEDLVFYGRTGRGKIHMDTALGIAATSAGCPVRSWQTAQLVLQLGRAKREGCSNCSKIDDHSAQKLLTKHRTSSATRPSTWTGRGSCARSYRTATRGGA